MLKKILWRLLFVVACLVTLVALFYAEENWRGKHAWETYKREREAKGDSFEWSSIVPPPVPDDQNFATTPLFAELFPKSPPHPRLEFIRLPACPKALGSWREGRVDDVAAWRACLTNSDLLVTLSKYEPILSEVAKAGQRPYSRFPIRYEDSFNARLPHLYQLRNLSQLYRLRALAELDAGQVNLAFTDIQMILRLAEAIKEEPLLISFLVYGAVLDNGIQTTWEGLARHRWSESQLTALQTEFLKVEPFESFEKTMHGERLTSHLILIWARQHPMGIFKLLSVDPTFEQSSWLDRIIPSGWFYQNQLTLDRFYTKQFFPAMDWEHQRISPLRMDQLEQTVATMRRTPYNILSKLLTSGETHVAKKAALLQTSVDEVVLACALERFRLAHGQLPEKLDALVPQFIAKLPHDVIDGQPLRYRRTSDSEFVLYSIGWNERDDGGQIAWTTGATPRQDDQQSDWVWFSQPLASERK